MKWRRLNGERLTDSILAEVEKAIIHETSIGNMLKVCIGTDSQVKGEVTEFATVIVFVRHQKGGFMFICDESTKKKMGLKERMLTEVARSIDIAYQLCNLLDKYNVELEVHAD